MKRFLQNAYRRYQYHLLIRGRRMAREVLLDKSDRELQDMGFSRDLLKAGIRHWPWRLDEQEQSFDTTPVSEARAISELRNMSDRELLDLGITRGTIEESVRYGRAGIDTANVDIEAPQVTTSVLHSAKPAKHHPVQTAGCDREVA
jgi:uncharacterized protein YjiS (DUF1127 family)